GRGGWRRISGPTSGHLRELPPNTPSERRDVDAFVIDPLAEEVEPAREGGGIYRRIGDAAFGYVRPAAPLGPIGRVDEDRPITPRSEEIKPVAESCGARSREARCAVS